MLPKIPLSEAREWLIIVQFAVSLFLPTDAGRKRRQIARRAKYIERQQDKLDAGKIDQATYDARVAEWDAVRETDQ